MKQYQAVVIGSGPGGYVAAIRLGQLGIRTAIVERDAVGGVCLNVGCIPSKAIIHAARVFHEASTAAEMGLLFDAPRVDLARTKSWKNSVVRRLTGGIEILLRKASVDLVRGSARFTARNRILVEGADGTSEIGAESVIVATGARPVEVPGFAFDGENVLSSTQALDLASVPDGLLVIGGGIIGLEIGMALRSFGATLTVVEMMDQLLPGFDPELVKVLDRRLRRQKTAVHLRARATGWTRRNGRLAVALETPAGPAEVVADRILLAVGRRPNSENLGLADIGVSVDARGFIVTDEGFRTSVPGVYAIGDVRGGAQLAHKASREGLVVAANVAGRNETWDVRAMPWGIFTDPEIASVGLTEEQAARQGLEVRTGRFPFAASGRALASRETEGFVKLVAGAKDDRVLGVHIVGPHAADLIAEAALAIEMGATAEDIALTIHTHPTLPEAVMEAAEAVHGRAIHIVNP